MSLLEEQIRLYPTNSNDYLFWEAMRSGSLRLYRKTRGPGLGYNLI